jgi:hypothetical protein
LVAIDSAVARRDFVGGLLISEGIWVMVVVESIRGVDLSGSQVCKGGIQWSIMIPDW